MNVTITIRRGHLDTILYDPGLQRRLETYLEQHEEDGRVDNQSSLYRRLLSSPRELTEVVSKVLGDDGNKPFTITIAVEGEKKVYPPGQSVNY